MKYKGRIGIDMTGGDTVDFSPILERTIKYLRIAAEKHPDYQFFAAGPPKPPRSLHVSAEPCIRGQGG